MKQLTVLVLGFFVFTNSSAQAASKAEVWELLQRIEGELRYYDQKPSDLDQVHARLTEALRVLRGNPITSPEACTDFAFGEYKKAGYSNSASLDKAADFCATLNENNTTLAVLNFFYEHLKKDGYAIPASLHYALELSQNIREENLGCVRTAFDRYAQDGYSKRTSLQKAVDFCAK
jgi:hypothetical protein